MTNTIVCLFFAVAVYLSLQQGNLFLTELACAAVVVIGAMLLRSLSPAAPESNAPQKTEKTSRANRRDNVREAAARPESHLA